MLTRDHIRAFALSTVFLSTAFLAIPALASASRQAAPIPHDLTAPPSAPSNQEATLEQEIEWRSQSFTLRSQLQDGQRVLELLDSRQRVSWSLAIPRTALSMVDQLRLESEVLEVRGGNSLLNVQIIGRSYGGTKVQFRAVIQDDGRLRNLRTLWSGRHAENDSGDDVSIIDLDNDGVDEIVLYARTPTVQFCGRDFAPLFPRIWDSRSRSFRSIVKKPEVPAGTQRLTLQPDTLPPPLFQSIELRSVSSNAARTVERSYGRAPNALSDGDTQTAWTTQSPGGGIGAFISAQANPAAGIAAVSFDFIGGKAPERLLIHLEDKTYEVHVPQGVTSGVVTFPEVSTSACATVRILEVPRGTSEVSIAELHFYSGLDLASNASVYETRIFQPYREASDAIERTRIARLMRVNDPTIVEGSLQLLNELEATQHPPIIEALMSTPIGRSALYAQLADGELSSASIAAIGRTLGRGDGDGINELYTALDSSTEPHTREALLRVLSRTVTNQDALRLLAYLGNETVASRADLAFGLGQAQFSDIDTLLLELNGAPTHDLILLRAVARIARRQAGRVRASVSPDGTAKLSDAMDNENGTVARVAHQLVGILGVEALRDRLLDAFENDPSSPIRLAALKGLAEYDRNFAEDTGNTLLLTDALDSDDPSIRIAAAQLLRDRTLDELEINFVLSVLRKELWSEASRPLIVSLIRQNRPDVDDRLAETLFHLEPTLLRSAFIQWQSRTMPPPYSVIDRLFDRARPNEANLIAWTRTAARLESEAGAELLRRHFADERLSIRVRAAMLEALGKQRVPSSLPVIQEQLKRSGSVELRRAAARSLAWHEQSESARSALEDALENETNPQVLDAVKSSLKALDHAKRAREILNTP